MTASTIKSTSVFEFVIIGGGLSGLQLALALTEDESLQHKSIAIIEPSLKNKNDKTWSFWEKGNGKWDDIIFKKWTEGDFISESENLKLDLGNYSYKMIRSIDFYTYALKALKSKANVKWIQGEVLDLSFGKIIRCKTQNGEVSGRNVFDARFNRKNLIQTTKPTILQHFKGWIIKTDAAIFDPNNFTMMDYRLGYKDHCCFTYVLPFSANEALVEFTFFTPELVEDQVYDALLSEYISTYLKIDDFELKETEYGVIPMSAYPFEKENRSNYLKIGTAGGWVKSSSGYSFKNTESRVRELVQCLKAGKPVDQVKQTTRFRFYDAIFLGVLASENKLGNNIFEQMYQKNPAHKIFKFLDEQSTISEELNIIVKFDSAPFLRSLKKNLFS